LVKPLIWQEVAGRVAVHVWSPSVEVKTIAVTDSPPLVIKVDQSPVAETIALRSPATAVTEAGASATPATLIGAEAVDESEEPTALIALTLKV
jgi:hypothetical protein